MRRMLRRATSTLAGFAKQRLLNSQRTIATSVYRFDDEKDASAASKEVRVYCLKRPCHHQRQGVLFLSVGEIV